MNIIVSKEDRDYINECLESGEVLKEDLRRWFKEKWVDVSKKVNGKHPPCGRKDAEGKSYPKCRPSKKVSKETPKVASSYSKKEKKSMTTQKRRAEKKNPKQGKGNTPTFTRYDESINEYMRKNTTIEENRTITLNFDTITETNTYPKLNSNHVSKIDISEGLKFHIVNKQSIIDNVYKKGTDNFNNLLEECRDLYMNGDLELSDDDLSFIMENEYGPIENTNYTVGDMLNEAEYQGRKVQLGKIMQGDIKKFKVYIKNDRGKVVKVNFGFGGKSAKGKRMVIKKNNPARRKSFRARMRCDNPGPRDSARYWACRSW
jgi:hypothetical protein